MRDIIGHGGGGDEQHTHYEATDSLHSTSYARVLDLVSEGEILGLAKGMESVFLDGTPVENPDGTKNFKDITVDFRVGTQTQDFIPGFPAVENETGVGVELRSGTPWTHAISNLALSAIRIMLGVPALTKSDTTNGDVVGYRIDYQIELSTDGGAYAVVLANSFNGKTTSPYRRSARIDLPPATTGWSIRVTRLTANANTASIVDTTTIVSYTDVIDAKLRYPMSAVVGVQVDAKQFSNVPTRAYDLYGRIVQVPTNYDPVARTYTGVWDGTFKPAWTSCPPWIFRDLVLNDRYGLGARITAAQVDKWALYAIARYCDEMVPDGKGGLEPRFACNVYLQTQKQAYAVLQDLASIFRGISYWGGGSVIASADMPTDPVYVYTAANVIDGKFSRVGSSKKTRYTVALVSWNDMTDFGRAKVEYVEDAEGIKRYGIQQVSMTAFGCSSQGQAQRVGRWALATSRFETGMITFDVGMDGAIALPGQIVRIADPARMGARNGGRIHSATGRVVTLDKAPVVNAGDKLTVILPSGKSETKTVSSVSGDAVTVSADWTTVPLAQSVWSVDSNALAAPTFKVLTVKENKSNDSITYTITATQHEPGKFAFVDSNTVIVPAVETSLDVSKQAPPLSVSVSGNTVSLNDVQKLSLTVTCAAVAGAVAYEGAYKRDNGNWLPLARQPGPTFDVPDVIAGTYTAKLSAINSIGIASTETLSAATSITKTIDTTYNVGARLSPVRVYAYQRSASAPTGTPGDVTVTIASNSITYPAVLANGWLVDIPTANGNPLYVVAISGAGSGATVNLLSAAWSGAAVMATDGPGGTGTNGTNGLNSATITIWQRTATATAPALPSAATLYTFATGVLTGLDNGWSTAYPSADPTKPFVQMSLATAIAATATDAIAASEWAAAKLQYDASAVIAAQAAADAANAKADAIAADGVLDRGEKVDLLTDMAAWGARYTQLTAQAAALGVSTTAYTAARDARDAYLVSLDDAGQPAWDDITQNTNITRATYRTKMTDYQREEMALLNAIAAKVQANAAADAASKISLITLGADGSLGGGPIGQVTLSGMGLKNWRVVSMGYNGGGSIPASPGLYLTGSMMYGSGNTYNLAVISRATGSVIYQNWYDVLGSGTNAAGRKAIHLANDLASYGVSSNVIVIWTYDEPQANRFDDGMATQMYRNGASRAVFGSPQFAGRAAYLLVSIGGCGEGNGAEAYQGDGYNDPNAWCDLGFQILNGNLVVSGSSFTPRTLADYAYTGALDATKNIVTAGTSAPGSPSNGDVWIDTNSPVTIKTRVAGAWVVGGNIATALSQINSGEAIKLSSVAPGATVNLISSGVLSSRPSGGDGDFYFATDTKILYQKVSGAWVAGATSGAPAGSLVNGVLAEDLTTQASAGATAQAIIASTVHGHGSGSLLTYNPKSKSGTGVLTFDARWAVGGGGVGPYTYSWEISGDVLDNGEGFYIYSGERSDTLVLKCLSGSGLVTYSVQAVCTIYDVGSSRVGYESVDHNATYS